MVHYVPNIEASGKLRHSLCPQGAYSLQMRDQLVWPGEGLTGGKHRGLWELARGI